MRFAFCVLCLAASIFTRAQNNFTLLNSPEGGPCIKMAQADNGDLYLLSKGGTLYNSSTQGENWQELPYSGAAFVDFVLLDNVIYAIDNHYLYISYDQGNTFSVKWYFDATWLMFIQKLPSKKLVLFGQNGSDFPLYISSDLGASWSLNNTNVTSAIPASNGFGFQSVFVSPDGRIFIPTFFGEVVSSDEGQTFQVSRTYEYQWSKMAFDSTRIYSLTFVDFVRSDEAAQSWSNIKVGLPTMFFNGLIAATDSQELIWLNPGLKSQQVYVSSDGGSHWTLQGDLPALGEEFDYLYSFQNQLFLLGSSGIYKSSDKGKTWSKKNSGLNAQVFQDILLKDSKLYVVTEPLLFNSDSSFSNWSQTQFSVDINQYNYPIFFRRVQPYKTSGLIVHNENGFDFKRSSRTADWEMVYRSEGGTTDAVSTIKTNDTIFFLGSASENIWKLLPDTTAWKIATPDWLSQNYGIFSIGETNDNHFLISYYDETPTQSLAKTTKDLKLVSKESRMLFNGIKAVGNNVFAIDNSAVYLSRDNGDNWIWVLNSPGDNRFRLFGDEKGRLFVGQDGKFQVTLDTGKTWKSYKVDDNLNRIVSGITTDSLGFIYLSVNNKGILKSNFSLSPVAQLPQAQTITFDSLQARTFGDPPFALTASSSSNLPITYVSSNTSIVRINGDMVTILAAGSVTITASQPGDSIYLASSAKRILLINKADQQIQFQNPTAKTFGDPSFKLQAKASSGLPIIFSSSDNSILSVQDSTATISGAGSITITASQSGNNDYNASSEEVTFCITPAIPDISKNTDNSNRTVLTSNSDVGNQWWLNENKLDGKTYDTLHVFESGSYSLTVTVKNCTSEFSDPLDVEIITADVPSNFEINVFPNPADRELNINFKSAESFKEFSVVVIDMQGRTITGNISAINNLILDVSSFPSSVYFLKVSSESENKVLKFVKK